MNAIALFFVSPGVLPGCHCLLFITYMRYVNDLLNIKTLYLACLFLYFLCSKLSINFSSWRHDSNAQFYRRRILPSDQVSMKYRNFFFFIDVVPPRAWLGCLRDSGPWQHIECTMFDSRGQAVLSKDLLIVHFENECRLTFVG